jgi:hypothetical protein
MQVILYKGNGTAIAVMIHDRSIERDLAELIGDAAFADGHACFIGFTVACAEFNSIGCR